MYRLRRVVGNFKLANYNGRKPPSRHMCLSMILDKIPERPGPSGPSSEPAEDVDGEELGDEHAEADGVEGDSDGDAEVVDVVEVVCLSDDEPAPEHALGDSVKPDEELDEFMATIFNKHPITKH